jgi:hypothetical protein
MKPLANQRLERFQSAWTRCSAPDQQPGIAAMTGPR